MLLCQDRQLSGQIYLVKLKDNIFIVQAQVKLLHPPLSNRITVSDQISLHLCQIGEKIDLIDRGMQRTEAALEQGSSPVPLLRTILVIIRFIMVLLQNLTLIRV